MKKIFTHAGQFETKDIVFNGSSGAVMGQDIYDEVSGFKAQWAYDPSTVGGFRSAGKITPSYIQNITDSEGNKPYGQGGKNNTGIAPVNINSTKIDVIKAYPDLFKKSVYLIGIKTFKDMIPNIYYKK